MELLRSGQLPADHWDWFVGAGFKFGAGAAGEEGEGSGAGDVAGDGATGELDDDVGMAAAVDDAGMAAAGNEQQQQTQPGDGEGNEELAGACCPRSGRLAGMPLASPFRLASADGLATPYTNLVPG